MSKQFISESVAKIKAQQVASKMQPVTSVPSIAAFPQISSFLSTIQREQEKLIREKEALAKANAHLEMEKRAQEESDARILLEQQKIFSEKIAREQERAELEQKKVEFEQEKLKQVKINEEIKKDQAQPQLFLEVINEIVVSSDSEIEIIGEDDDFEFV